MSISNNIRRYFAFPIFLVFAVTMVAVGLTRAGQDNQNTGSMMQTNKPKPTRRRPVKKPAASVTTEAPAENTSGGETADLSGSYTGVVNYPDGSMTGPATLNISANQFTLTPDGGSPVTGRITAETTRGYTGATMQFGTFTATPPGGTPGAPPMTISVRAKKVGTSLTLTSVEGELHNFSFAPGGHRTTKTKK